MIVKYNTCIFFSFFLFGVVAKCYFMFVYRLGETDKALYHYKLAGSEADPEEMAKVKKIQFHLNKCTEARRIGDWNNLIKEASYAISSGADSAPQVRYNVYHFFSVVI